jgi:non-ribosomal peptide synthetase component F
MGRYAEILHLLRRDFVLRNAVRCVAAQAEHFAPFCLGGAFFALLFYFAAAK